MLIKVQIFANKLTKRDMNKKILMSFGVIAIVAAIAIGGTVAYFSDTETSTGNTFTAGSIDLKIDLTRDGTRIFDLKDLVAGTDKFFNYVDVKPGDKGEMTVSLHVYSNDACGRFRIKPNVDNDMSCPEPEAATGDTTCESGLNGELDDYLTFRIWADDGDNVWETGEPFLTSCGGSEWCLLSDIDPAGETWSLGVLTASTTYYIGVEWKLPSTTGNIAQTDSWGADVAFDAIQHKNNTNCLFEF